VSVLGGACPSAALLQNPRAKSMKNTQLDHAGHRPASGPLPLRFLAHDVGIAANVGSLFRIADALGVEHVHLTGASPLPPDPKIRKAARSAENVVPYSHAEDPLAVVAELKAAGYRIVSLELTTLSVDVGTLALARGDRVCLVVGAEKTGVCQALLDVSDLTAHIPMRGRNSSMNVATACAIATYEIARRMAG
jgi:tRNA G18 (ribose-2'-O)-methylase SpoU